MLRKAAACDECTQNCVLVHRKKNGPSLSATRFFKFMHGKNYSEVLFLPPKFARTVRDLVGDIAQIEDSNGKTWPVTFSNVNGSLALQEGWPKFFREHHLEFGDVLLFNYVKRGHFIVHIFDTSACERLNFSPRRPRNNKRLKPNLETVLLDEPSRTADINPMDEPSPTTQFDTPSKVPNGQTNHMAKDAPNYSCDLGKAQLQPTYINLEDPICMMNRDVDCPDEDRNYLHDLSNFEMKKTTSNVKNNDKSLNDSESKAYDVGMTDAHSNGYFTNQFQIKPSDKGNSSTDMQEDVNKTQNDETRFTIRVGGVILTSGAECQSIRSHQVAEQENAFIPKSFGFDDSSARQAAVIQKELADSREKVKTSVTESPSIRSGQVSKQKNDFMPKPLCSSLSRSKLEDLLAKQAIAIKKEIFESSEKVNTPANESQRITSFMLGNLPPNGMRFGLTSSPVVKMEPDLSYDTAPSVAVSSFSAEVKNHSYLELPACILSSSQKREVGQKMVVHLIDATGRLWPVLYANFFYAEAFTGNWRNFCEANRVEPGDVCNFQLENPELCLYRVYVVHKSGQF